MLPVCSQHIILSYFFIGKHDIHHFETSSFFGTPECSVGWLGPVAQWLELLTCYQKVPGLNPGSVITFPWFCHLCLIFGITPVVLRMCKRWQHLVKCAGPMRSWNLQLGKAKCSGVWLICPFGRCPIISRKLVWQTEKFWI